jgi:hypothetical protein
MKLNRFLLIALALMTWVAPSSAMPYDRNAAVAYANRWWNGRNQTRFRDYHGPLGGDCASFASQCADSAFGGAFNWVDRYTAEQWNGNWPKKCLKPLYWADENGCMPWSPHLKDWLISRLQCPFESMPPSQRHKPSQLDVGDYAVYKWREWDPQKQDSVWRWHFVVIIGFDQQGNPLYADHCGDGGIPPGPPHDTYNGDLLGDRPGATLFTIHVPDQVLFCEKPACGNSFDSTFSYWDNKHAWVCCWKEILGDSPPWTSNPTAYACLNWKENRGETWDTLISHRMNLAACSSIVLRQKTNSLLPTHGTILGSTNNGVDWTQTVGDEHTTEVSLPWATNQRDVRLAWCYHGPVAAGKYWCIDDVELLAKPTRSKDLCVTEIKTPRGVITQGKVIRPKVYIWNAGKNAATSSVRVTIGSPPYAYDQTRTVMPFPYNDTMLELDVGWVATPGTWVVKAYTNLTGDEVSANDTASLTFQVVANTWTKMYPIYGGGGMASGACLATVDSNQIFCATGRKNYFAKYLVREDLWKVMATTPRAFTNGAALVYPGYGDFIYACRGSASLDFYRYSISADRWTVVANPYQFRFGSGASMAYGGAGYIFILRGRQSSDFIRYIPSSEHWTTKASVPAKIKQGASLVWTGGDSLYAFCGGDQKAFYRYKISKDSWASRTETPYDVDDGGAMAYYPPGNKVYAFFGNSKYYFYAYDPVSKVWNPRADAPNKVKNGGCLTYCDYSIYGGLGIGKDDDFWRYSPSVGGFLGAGGSELEPLEPALAQPAAPTGVLGDHLDPGEQLTYDPSEKYSPQYSPDGLWIAYTASDSMSEGIGLYRIPAIGGMPETLGPDSLAYESPKWFDDATALAAVADDGIYKISSGMPSVRLAEGIVEKPQVTGAWVVYEKWDTIGQTHDVYKVRSDGTGNVCLTPGPDEYLEPQPISDSEFVCLKLKDEVYQVCKVTAGQEAWLTSDYMNNASLDLSPDGLWLTYEKLDESGHWQVYKIRTDGTEESRVTDGVCNCRTPVFSPNGQYIAYTRWPVDSTGTFEFSQVCYSDVNIPGGWVVLHDADAERENPCWSPNCQYIIYEKTVESSSLSLGKKEKHKQIGRARTHVRPFDGVQGIDGLPRAFALYQNRPNPFGRTTAIRYAIPMQSFTELNIFDVAGRTVTRLVQSEQKPGYYSVAWKGTDMRGRSVAAGTYFYVLKSNGKIAQKRMLLVR